MSLSLRSGALGGRARWSIAVLAASAALLCGVSFQLHAEQHAATRAQQDQLTRGEDVYFASCVECHNSDLSGGSSHSAPALAGDAFRARWAGHSAFELLDRTRSTMPQDQPKSLSEQAYADVVAFLLTRNNVSLGDAVFDAQVARQIPMK